MLLGKRKKRSKLAAKRSKKREPWIELFFVIGAIYGPRAFVLWKMFQAQKAEGNGPKVVEMPAAQPSAADTPVN
jgi:hypothetical protein